MKTTRVTARGQVTIPKVFGDPFGWKPGDQIKFVREEDGVRIVAAKRQTKGEAIVERLRQVP